MKAHQKTNEKYWQMLKDMEGKKFDSLKSIKENYNVTSSVPQAMIRLGLVSKTDYGAYMAQPKYNPSHAIRLHKKASEIQRSWGNKKVDKSKPVYIASVGELKEIEQKYYKKYAKVQPKPQVSSRRIIIMWGLIDIKF
jgi:hypothetical protein